MLSGKAPGAIGSKSTLPGLGEGPDRARASSARRGSGFAGRALGRAGPPSPGPVDPATGEVAFGLPPVMLTPGGPEPLPPPPVSLVPPGVPAGGPPGAPGCGPSGESITRAARLPSGTRRSGVGSAGEAASAINRPRPASALLTLGPISGAGPESDADCRG